MESEQAPGTRRHSLEEIAEARENPGTNLYVIRRDHDPDGAVPPEAIEGAWTVGQDGVIVGDFIENPRYRPLGPADS